MAVSIGLGVIMGIAIVLIPILSEQNNKRGNNSARNEHTGSSRRGVEGHLQNGCCRFSAKAVVNSTAGGSGEKAPLKLFHSLWSFRLDLSLWSGRAPAFVSSPPTGEPRAGLWHRIKATL